MEQAAAGVMEDAMREVAAEQGLFYK